MRRLRSDLRREDGFTLIELLIVMLIIGLLASIALGAFLSRRIPASDASAKQMANTAEQAAVIYSLSNPSGYGGMTPAALRALEPSINIVTNGQTILAAAAQTLTGYSLAVVSSAADIFTITVANGVISRTCSIAVGNGNTSTNTGGGCRNGTW
jgi:prepilin-type N-terminal cleavage/methylation domain-containing protein